MKPLLSEDPEILRNWLCRQGAQAYRTAQIWEWIFRRRVRSFDQMSNLPKTLRRALEETFVLWTMRTAEHRQADDGTEKLLLQLQDGQQIECVLLRDGKRRSICISTQVGCAMGCVFCASGLEGVDRNLTSGEILEQMLQLQRIMSHTERLSHIVVMGMGEPLANLDNLLPALARASAADGFDISSRRITISTVGLPAAIDRLADLGTNYHLAVSLHAADDLLRNRLVPVNEKIGLKKILAASDRYFRVSGRRLTFEYVLLAGINDSCLHARQLVSLLQGKPVMINVIPFNPVKGLSYCTPSPQTARQFREILQKGGLNIQLRQRKGNQINAACGQLRRSVEPAAVTRLPLKIAPFRM